MTEAFVYCWTDLDNYKLYVGVHKGHINDGYISSSKVFNKEYFNRPTRFSRQIIASGSFKEMGILEAAILKSADAAKSEYFYNRNNNNGLFFCISHTKQTRDKMSRSWKLKGKWNCSNELAVSAWRGKKHSEESKSKMSSSQQKHSKTRSKKMMSNNPMKDPILVAKMLETRRKNKEAKNVNAN